MNFYCILIYCVSCILSVAVSTAQEPINPYSLLRANPLVVVETEDCQAILEETAKLDIAKNPRWTRFIELLNHPEFGVFNPYTMEMINDIKDRFVESLKPRRVVFCLDNTRNWTIQITINSESTDPEQTVSDLFSRILQVQQEESLDPRLQTQDDEYVIAEDTKIYCNSSLGVYWFVVREMLVLTGNLNDARRIVKQIKEPTTRFNSLRDSRGFLAIRNKIRQSSRSTKNPLASLSIHVSPRLLSVVTSYFNEKQIRAWGLHEIVGLGLSVNVFDSESRPDSREFVVNGYLKSTQPRTGIVDAIRLKGRPKALPELPENKALFAYINFDYRHFLEQKKSLYDKANGVGAYEKYMDGRGRVSGMLGQSHRDSYSKSLGNMHGICWYSTSDRLATSSFSQTSNPELLMETLVKLTTTLESVSKRLGYVRCEVNGYKAMLTKSKNNRLGFLFKDGWVAGGEESFLKSFANSSEQEDSPTEVAEMTNDLLQYVRFGNEHSIVIAIWPKFWEVLRVTSISQRIRIHLEKQYAKSSESDKSYLEAFKELTADFEAFESDEPDTAEECRELTRFTITRILTESFGKSILLVGDEITGFRFCFMSYPL